MRCYHENKHSSLLKNHTCDHVPLPKGQKLIHCKWVYIKKYVEDELVNNHKECLMSNVFS